MAPSLQSVLALLMPLLGQVLGECVSYGSDFANGGRYNLDGSSNDYFSFGSVFQGCRQETIKPVLVGPDDGQYTCSPITTTPDGAEQVSTCGIPLSAMRSGTWKIVIEGSQVHVQRSIILTVGKPDVNTVTATPTVVIGILTTGKATTIIRTVQQTASLILAPSIVTTECSGRTVTAIGRAKTVTVYITNIRTETVAGKTSYATTTTTSTASCRLREDKRELDGRAEAAVAAQTVTVTQTTYTATRTLLTTVTGATTTETVFRTVTTTIQPPTSTVCRGGGTQQTLSVVAATQTATSMVYETSTRTGTVWIVETWITTATNAASSLACWRSGGVYGR